MLLFTFPILLLASPISVFACEGDCIIGITDAWLGNYTSPIDTVFQYIVRCRAAAHTLLLMLRRPSKFHEICSPLEVTTIQCNTCTPSRQPTKTARTTV